jgi:hypothetical protein
MVRVPSPTANPMKLFVTGRMSENTRLWEKGSTEFDKLPDSCPFSDFNCDTNFQYKHKTAEAKWHSSPIGNLPVILLSQGHQLLIALLHHSHSVKTANCDKAWVPKINTLLRPLAHQSGHQSPIQWFVWNLMHSPSARETNSKNIPVDSHWNNQVLKRHAEDIIPCSMEQNV